MCASRQGHPFGRRFLEVCLGCIRGRSGVGRVNWVGKSGIVGYVGRVEVERGKVELGNMGNMENGRRGVSGLAGQHRWNRKIGGSDIPRIATGQDLAPQGTSRKLQGHRLRGCCGNGVSETCQPHGGFLLPQVVGEEARE